MYPCSHLVYTCIHQSVYLATYLPIYVAVPFRSGMYEYRSVHPFRYLIVCLST